jgi:hypothetical protein
MEPRWKATHRATYCPVCRTQRCTQPGRDQAIINAMLAGEAP